MTLSRAATSALMGLSLVLGLLTDSSLAQAFAPQQSQPARNPNSAPQQGANPQQFGPQRVAAAPRQGPPSPQILPCPFGPLSQREQAYLDDVLKYWEQRSDKVNRFDSKFIRWVYDTKFGPQDPRQAKTISYGEIKYEKPDKGMFRVDRITHYVAPTPPAEATYEETQGEVGEHWVCDGKSVFVFNSVQKQLQQFKLPGELQGEGIVNGPLPFLFGAKSDKIKARYWTRMLLPPPVKDQYWMEAYPKFMEDRAQYQKVVVILDKEQYLPIALQVYARDFDVKNNPSREVFQFQDRVENPNLTLQKLNIFHRAFFEPQVPTGWQKVVEQIPAGGARMAQGPNQVPAGGPR
jgi:TIGR03009 family protein